MALSETAKVPNGSPTPTPETRKCHVQAMRRSGPYAATPILAYSAGSRAMSVSTMRRSPIADNHSIKRSIGCKVAHSAAIDIVSKLRSKRKRKPAQTCAKSRSPTNTAAHPTYQPAMGLACKTPQLDAERGEDCRQLPDLALEQSRHNTLK